ncbi:hypothetical protein QTJ00_08730 [Clostridium perfringens]|nr:hypothetical protein [Clostridium perfringens]
MEYIWLPFKVLSIYILGLLLLSVIGPVKYDYNWLYFLIMTIYLLVFLLITWIGMAISSSYKPKFYSTNKKEKRLIKILKVSILITLLIKIMLAISSIKILGIPQISNIFSMMATIYSNLHQGEEVTNIYRQIDTFFTFIYYFSTFIAFFWKKKISNGYFFIVILNILLDLFYQVFYIGTQRSIITIVILVISLFSVRAVSNGYKVDKAKLRKVIFIILILIIFFINTLSARKQLWNTSDAYIYAKTNFDYNNILLRPFSDDMVKYNICNLISYFTQGYYCLSLCFQVPFQWTYMIGSARGLNSIITQIFTDIPNFTYETYPVRAGLIFGHDGLANWYTIFPWLASDYTFGGALIYMGIVAMLFMRCWIQSVKYDNPIAFLMLVLLIIQYVFIIANNQLFIQRGESVATIIIFILYIICNKKYNFLCKN